MLELLWYAGQTGIVVELVGAALGVRYAWETKVQWQSVSRVTGTYDHLGRSLAMPGEEFVGQYAKQMRVFGLIALGLVLQFAGNFAGR